MKAPLSWLEEYIDIELSIEDLAHRMTLAGLEVEEIRYVGTPLPDADQRREAKISGFAWDPDKIVVGAILEVMPHPNADRLVLCKLDDGEQVHIALTGAPNLYAYKDAGPLEKAIKVAFAREGATIINAYEAGNKPTTLKRKKIRGVESYSMACSERELGISDAHEGIIILDDEAPIGVPLVDYIGDVVFDIAITPNFARDANIIGIAREIAAISGQPAPRIPQPAAGDSYSAAAKKFARIKITDPKINPRFALGLIENVEIKPSPYKTQLRLKLSGVRPINGIVDATNYAMLEVGEPLHAFDYDVLLKRAKAAGQDTPTIITRAAKQGQKLVTLDDVERELDDFTVLVCDQSGPLALAGVMGGAESEVSESTKNVLLEGAAWNMINTRRTVMAQNLPSEASYRFSRGVHPEVAPQGIQHCLSLMHKWAGGIVIKGLIDNYPSPHEDPSVEITPKDVRRWLGIDLTAEEIVQILTSLEFECQITSHDSHTTIQAKTPPHRLDIGTGVVGKADLMEEIARVYGYDRVPETRISDDLPPQRGNYKLETEEALRDLLVNLGLQEVINHRLTSSETESRRFNPDADDSGRSGDYFEIANPISPERAVLRRSLLASVLDTVERNARIRVRIAIFEIGPVFLRVEGSDLPNESKRLAMAITGPRALKDWGDADTASMDFFDLKGIINSALDGLHLTDIKYAPSTNPSFHPGKCADVYLGDKKLGSLGELHPLVSENYDLPDTPLMAAEFDLSAIIAAVPPLFDVAPISGQPPILEDIALIVDEDLPAADVEFMIRQTGGKTLTDVRLFDVYRGEQIGAGKKSLAYSLTYQSAERTLTDKEAAKLRNRIVKRLERELGAQLRG